MRTVSEDHAATSHEQRVAMLRVFGGTAFAFIALLIVSLLVRPDLMRSALGMVTAMMP